MPWQEQIHFAGHLQGSRLTGHKLRSNGRLCATDAVKEHASFSAFTSLHSGQTGCLFMSPIEHLHSMFQVKEHNALIFKQFFWDALTDNIKRIFGHDKLQINTECHLQGSYQHLYCVFSTEWRPRSRKTTYGRSCAQVSS